MALLYLVLSTGLRVDCHVLRSFRFYLIFSFISLGYWFQLSEVVLLLDSVASATASRMIEVRCFVALSMSSLLRSGKFKSI